MSEPTSRPIVVKGVDIEATGLKADFNGALSVHIVDIDPSGQVTTPPKKFDIFNYKELRGTFVPEGKKPKDGFKMVRVDDDSLLMADVHAELSKADAITGWYSKGYDLPFLNSRMLDAGLPPLPPVPHIDLYYVAKHNFALASNRLAAWQEFLKLEIHKTPLLRSTWRSAASGNPEALQYVSDHCFNDAAMLRPVYYKLAPYQRTFPNLNNGDLGRCKFCLGTNLQSRGKRYFSGAKMYKRLVQCLTINPQTRLPCGKWDTRLV